jgi:hypothetical protein
MIAIGAAGVVGVGWLLVSFLQPGRGRSIIEWLSALALYLVIVSMMANGFRRFWAADNELLIGVFGFLVFLFGTGFLLTIVMAIREITGRGGPAGPGATH